jgi:Fur family transcriptional regulator, peroxide stress response regulator
VTTHPKSQPELAEVERRMQVFRRKCAEQGLAKTHQRCVLYRALAETGLHLSPEALYERVRREIPAISLGTVYKNIKTFVDAGILHEIGLPHESLRLDANLAPHHHLVCRRCKTIFDLSDADLEPLDLRQKPRGFRMERYRLEITGLCAGCAGEDVSLRKGDR